VVHSSDSQEEELMDQALSRFRKTAARENRDRRTVRRRYSTRLQHQAVEYWRTRQTQGEGMRDVAIALGVAPWSLYRWTRASEQRARFHPVQVVTEAPTAIAGPVVVVVKADGLHVEGLDVTAAAQLLRLLR
jgi:hypothetical protein